MLFHLGLITQLTLLARKIIEFDGALRLLETSDRRNHPLRLELHNFFFVQAIAGPDRSLVVSAFLHGMSWLTLVVLPVLMLLYIQAVFLPYHSVPITWIYRAALLVDMGLLSLLGVFLARKETSFGTAFIRNALSRPITFLFTSVLLVLVALVSLFIATIPGERLDGTASGLLPLSAPVGSQAFVGGYAAPFSLARSDGSLLGIFRRNLDIRDQDLVDDKADGLGQATLNLRYRDLRFARFDRGDSTAPGRHDRSRCGRRQLRRLRSARGSPPLRGCDIVASDRKPPGGTLRERPESQLLPGSTDRC